MALGTYFKPRRKAGTIIGGDLRIDEVGLDTTNNIWYHSTDGTSVVAIGAGGGDDPLALVVPVTAVAHGIAVDKPIYKTASGWALSDNTDPDTAEYYGTVTTVVDVDNLLVTIAGEVTGLTGLTAGELYWMDAAGAITATKPTTVGHVAKPIYRATSTTSAQILHYRGEVISAADISTGLKIVQQVVEQLNPSSGQALTTSYVDLEHGEYDFTPVSASSKIVYELLHVASRTPDTTGIGHFKMLVDGVMETEGNWSDRTPTAEKMLNWTFTIASWGTTMKTLKIQGRDYSGTLDMVLFNVKTMDGSGATTTIVRPTLRITEYL